MAARRSLRDEQLQQALERDGFVSVPLLDADDLAALQEGFARLRPGDHFAPDGTTLNQCTYHCTFLDPDEGYKREVDELVRRVFDPHIDRVLEDYRMLTSNFYVKPPGRGVFDVHQNWHTIDDPQDTTVTVWCPLHAVDESNATIQVVPGSHKLVPDVVAGSIEPWFKDFVDDLIDRHLEPVPLRAGDALVFDDTLLHWSADNRSDRPRVAVQIETIPVDKEPVLYALDADDPHWIDIVRIDEQFWIERTIADVVHPPAELEVVGRRPNENRPITCAEFEQRLRRRRDERRVAT